MHRESIEARKYTKRLHNLLLRSLHRDLEDPLFRRITINHLRLNRTRTCATVYLDLVSVKDPRRRSLIIRKINGLNPLFRSALGRHLDRRRIPHLRFLEDRVFAGGQRVEALIERELENGAGD